MAAIINQYNTAPAPQPKVVIMDGGGNDVLQNPGCAPGCAQHVQAVTQARDFFRQAQMDGVQHIIFIFYYDMPVIKAGLDWMRPQMAAECQQSPVLPFRRQSAPLRGHGCEHLHNRRHSPDCGSSRPHRAADLGHHAEGLRRAVVRSANQVVLNQPNSGAGAASHPELLEDSPDVDLYSARRDVEFRADPFVGLASRQELGHLELAFGEPVGVSRRRAVWQTE
jgi:hypothetical protein